VDAFPVFMERCLELAKRGAGRVAPNPMVGCVIVHENKIISEGWHENFGENHAERNAILKIQNDPRLKESTLYVNLEPCAHHGKTPPCAALIVSSGIKKVVIGSADPFEKVNGKGVKLLRNAGVEVLEHFLQKACDILNAKFILFHTNKRPYIILKWAQTADGFMAPFSKIKTQISGEEASILLHKWRSEEQAILIGANTVMHDKPALNLRHWQGKNPQRFVLDGNLSNTYPFDEAEISVFNFTKNEITENVKYIQIDKNNSLVEVLKYLYENNILSILLEGGAQVLNAFIVANLYDEIRIIESKSVYFETGIGAPKRPAWGGENFKLPMDTITIYKNNPL